MSRGLGALQREILAIYDEAVSQVLYREDEVSYASSAIKSYHWLLRAVCERRGAWCTTECRAPGHRYEQHRSHPNWRVLGWGFRQSFSRALRTLVRRGALLTVTSEGLPTTIYRTRHLGYVVRGKR